MSKQILHIVEPTLFDQTGHGYSYVHSLLQANTKFDIHVWLDKRGQDLLPKHLCVAHLFFWRPLRQLQKIFLYYQLSRSPSTIFVSTADLWDLRVLTFWAKYFRAQAKIFIHFHQFKQTTKKISALQSLAYANPSVIFTPTEKLSEVFSKVGFKCVTVPCPTFYPQRTVESEAGIFKKLLYAGAARSDKGFATVIQLLRNMRANQDYTPFAIQISMPNSQRYDTQTTQALQMLETIPSENLTLYKHTLDKETYLGLFQNAICLLLYDQKGYSDKFSGIALDAFYAGCPIITVRNTWMGDTATKYQAGIAVESCDIELIKEAIYTVIKNYAFYQQNAKNAAVHLQKQHDPSNTLNCLEINAGLSK